MLRRATFFSPATRSVLGGGAGSAFLSCSVRKCSSTPPPPPSSPPSPGSNGNENNNNNNNNNNSGRDDKNGDEERRFVAETTVKTSSSSSSSSTSTTLPNKSNSSTPPKGFELFHAPFFKRPLTPDSAAARSQPQPAILAIEQQIIQSSDRDFNRRHKNRRLAQFCTIMFLLYVTYRFWFTSNTKQIGGENFYYHDSLKKKKTATTATTYAAAPAKEGDAQQQQQQQQQPEVVQDENNNTNGNLVFLPDANVRYITVSPEEHSATFFAADGRKLFTQRFIDFKHWLRDIQQHATLENGPFVRTEVYIGFPFVAICFLWLMPILGRFYRSVNGGLGAARAEAHAAIRRQQASAETETPTKGRFRFKKEHEVTTRLNDVAGLTEAKHEVTEIVDFLRAPAKYEALGAKLPKGVLIDGPPGTGKTLLARAVAGEAGLNFVSCSGSEFDEVYVGVGAMRVRELFKAAREAAPCVIFIDEIDTFGKKRKRDARGSSRGTINALLSELDGFKEASRIMVLAATNRADILDEALTRSGRFDRKITVDLPPLKDRIAIALVHLKPLKLAPGLAPQKVAETLAALTPGCSGADIYNVCNEAAIVASRLNKEHGVDMECFHKSMDRIMIGLERKARKFEKHERERLAIHEAGHVVLSWFLKSTDPIMKATIAPRGGSTEGTSRKLPHERFIITQDSLHERMVQGLGGYVAEEFFFHDVSANAAEDLAKVTEQAKAEICTYGMAPKTVGHFGFPTSEEDRITEPYGPEKSNVVDKEINALVNSVSDRARQMLKQYVTEVRMVAGLLMKQESVTAKELWIVLGERPVMTKEFRDYLESDHSS